MKITTCNALAGACDFEIIGETPEEMAENSKKHAMEMFAVGDQAHIDAMEKMKSSTPEDQQKFFEDFKNNFNLLDEA